LNQREASEVVFGGVLTGDINAGSINPEWLTQPYNRAIIDVADGMMDPTELMAKFDHESISVALEAAEAVDFIKFDWPRHLRDVAVRYRAGSELEKIGKHLKQGRNELSDQILKVASDIDKGQSSFVRMSEVEPLEEAWVPSYYPPIDDVVGGLPIGGLMLIAGPAGLGKTTLALEMMMCAAKEEKYVAFFSLEMVLGAAAMRLLELDARATKYQEYIFTTDRIMGIRDVYAEAVRLASEVPLYTIFIDYCDMMVEREQSEQTMGEIYNGAARLAKTTGIPVVALAGVSRGYVGGRPRTNHIRYSGRAEHAATVILLIYRPAGLDVDMADDSLPAIEDQGYIIVGKSRYRMNRPTLGAIQLEWDEARGRWGSEVLDYIEDLSG
jgi:replicative DNA helicase